MKIDQINQNLNQIIHPKEQAVKGKEEGRNGKVQGLEGNRGVSTEIEFSEKSVEFSKAAKIIEKTPPERAELVNEIKAKIEEGTYDIDSMKIADKILKDALSDIFES